jgi:hypothetical protein
MATKKMTKKPAVIGKSLGPIKGAEKTIKGNKK